MKYLRELMTAGLTLLFPPSCPCCRKMLEDSEQLLCEDCFEQLKFIKKPYCSCCGKVFTGGEENHLCGVCLQSRWKFDKVRSFFAYEEIIAGLIHKLKYSGDMTGLETLRWLGEQNDVLHDLDTPDYILPVPLHVKRLRKRGFNQALVLARSLFPDEKKKIRYDILLRTGDTPSQTGLSGKERRKNLKKAFVIEKASEVAGKNILLVDDVFTTGATANECANALKAAGCETVNVLTICRADKMFP